MINIYINILLNKEEVIIQEQRLSIYDDIKINFKKRNIIIGNEKLFIKDVNLRKGDINKEINKNILESFGENRDYLFHTNISKDRKKVLIYVIKAGERVGKLCEGARKVKIIPLQFIIANKFKNTIKENNWIGVIKILDKIYILEYENKSLINSFIEDDIYNLNKRILEIGKEKNIYISKEIEELNFKNKYYIIKEELKKDDIFNKRFFTL